MGSVFGKESVAEPPHDVLLRRGGDAATPYELRRYGERFAASVAYPSDGNNNSNDSPFRELARYIGVFGTPANEGSTSISMTAPVVMEREDGGKPEAIAMTAPVVMEKEGGDGGMKKMMFMLPSEYDDMSKIPKPTSSRVRIEEIPPEVGVVHRYNGNFNDEVNRARATELGAQLALDGVEGVDAEYAADHFQFWGYNPPFTIPYFKRNEVWLKLTDDQASHLREKFGATSGVEGGLKGGSVGTMKGRTMLTVGVVGLVAAAYAIGMVARSRSQYRQL